MDYLFAAFRLFIGNYNGKVHTMTRRFHLRNPALVEILSKVYIIIIIIIIRNVFFSFFSGICTIHLVFPQNIYIDPQCITDYRYQRLASFTHFVLIVKK